MKTSQPLILTATLAEADLAPLAALRQQHFPPDRNYLTAHLTMFHRLPGEKQDRILSLLQDSCAGHARLTAEVSGIRHLGAGVAFAIDSPALAALRAELKQAFLPWLNPQDMQGWKPHVTIQNKVARAKADDLHQSLSATFQPWHVQIIGVDLWAYLGGPWRHEAHIPLQPA